MKQKLELLWLALALFSMQQMAAGTSLGTSGATPDPDCVIYYTSSDGNIITPTTSYFGAYITSNTYENGQGCITFNGKVTKISSYAFD
jgi:hypothetical protein